MTAHLEIVVSRDAAARAYSPDLLVHLYPRDELLDRALEFLLPLCQLVAVHPTPHDRRYVTHGIDSMDGTCARCWRARDTRPPDASAGPPRPRRRIRLLVTEPIVPPEAVSVTGLGFPRRSSREAEATYTVQPWEVTPSMIDTTLR